MELGHKAEMWSQRKQSVSYLVRGLLWNTSNSQADLVSAKPGGFYFIGLYFKAEGGNLGNWAGLGRCEGSCGSNEPAQSVFTLLGF